MRTLLFPGFHEGVLRTSPLFFMTRMRLLRFPGFAGCCRFRFFITRMRLMRFPGSVGDPLFADHFVSQHVSVYQAESVIWDIFCGHSCGRADDL